MLRQSDIESVHRLIEDEFYRTEDFYSREGFLKKASSYQLFFNVARKNSYKGDLLPLQIIKERTPQIDPKVILLPPVSLDALFIQKLEEKNQRGTMYPLSPYGQEYIA